MFFFSSFSLCDHGTQLSWSHGSWIYSFLCNQCISPIKLWVQIPLKRVVLDTTLCDKVCKWLAAGRWFSLGSPISSTNKTDHHDIIEILLQVALNTIAISSYCLWFKLVKIYCQFQTTKECTSELMPPFYLHWFLYIIKLSYIPHQYRYMLYTYHNLRHQTKISYWNSKTMTMYSQMLKTNTSILLFVPKCIVPHSMHVGIASTENMLSSIRFFHAMI